MNKKLISPTKEQLQNYNTMRKNGNITRNTNLRFGKIVFLSDSDLDGRRKP